MSWPKNADGTTNWDEVFESPDQGLILLIDMAQTLDTLRNISSVVIEKLFTRIQDASHRRAYAIVLDGILPLDGLDESKEFKQAKAEVIALMRHIKEERKKKAADYIAKLEAEKLNAAKAEKEEINRRTPEPESVSEPTPPPNAPVDADCSATTLFIDVFAQYYRHRFEALREGIGGKTPPGKTPFILSKAFEAHFIETLTTSVIPRLASYAQNLIDKAVEKPQAERRAFLENLLDKRATREKLWEQWQLAWGETLEVRPLPAKPKEETKKGGMLSSLGLSKEKSKPSWAKKEPTLQEWKATVKEIKAANTKAKETWEKITAPSTTYESPLDEDNKALKELFGRSPAAIAKQTRAIRQIFEQGGNVARTFDAFMSKARNFDTSLLSVCWQEPNLLLGEDKKLANALSAYDDKFKQQHFRLTTRFVDLVLDKNDKPK